MIDYGSPELAVHHPSELGEGPVWYEQKQILFWLDSFDRRIHLYNPGEGWSSSIILPEVIGSLAVMDAEYCSFGACSLILAMKSGIYLLNLPDLVFSRSMEWTVAKDDLHFLDNPESNIRGNRFNDGKCDPAGRFWAGTMSRALDSGAGDLTPRGKLYSFELHDGTPVSRLECSTLEQLDTVIISNGLAWSPDNKTLYYNDTPTRKIGTFDYDLKTGRIQSSGSAWAVPDGWGNPDGMTIDREGMLWVALWDGFRVVRVDPGNGTVLGEIRLPVRNVTSCCFGGKELDYLYITTSRSGLENDDKSDPDLAGSVFRLKLPVRGTASQTARLF